MINASNNSYNFIRRDISASHKCQARDVISLKRIGWQNPNQGTTQYRLMKLSLMMKARYRRFLCPSLGNILHEMGYKVYLI